MTKLLTFCVTPCFLLLTALVNAGTGDLDPTFGTGGIAKLSYAEGRAVNVKASAKQQDGRIVVVGDMASPDDGLQHVVFARLNNDGTLDTTFGNAGWTFMPAAMSSTFPYPASSCSAVGVARGNNSIKALGNCGGNITLFSVNLDGTPDLNFGSWYGNASRIDENSANLTARAIAVDSQGRIIIGGSRRTGPTLASNAFMKRYLSNGVADQTFGNAFGMLGLSTQSLALGDDELLALAVDGTDRIVGVGYGTPSLGGARFMLATRFQANGTIGPFGYTNQNFVSYTGEGDTAHAVALENSGAIVVAGTAGYTHWNGQSSSKFYVWRLDANGYTSPEGAVAIDMPIEVAHDANASASAVHITQDGWIAVVGGTVANSTATRTAYVCVYPNSTVASICGSQGRYFGPPSLNGGGVLGLYTASDYKFLSVGRKGDAVSVARFNNSEAGVVDTAFGTNGAAIYAPWLATQVALNGLAVQPDGKLIVAATSQAGGARVGRLDASGQPDVTFGTAGYYDLGDDQNWRARGAFAAAVQGDGKILVALRSETISTPGDAFSNVIRLNADGTRDGSWISFAASGIPAAIAVKADGRVVLLSSQATPAKRMVLTQLGTDGSILASATLPGTGAEEEVATSLALDANGNALAAGYSRMWSTLSMLVYRYTDSLQPDWSWGGGTFAIVDFGTSSAARGVAVGADGKVVLAGACGSSIAHPCFARLDPTGQLDTSFGVGGRVVHMLTPSGERAVSAHVTPQGKTFAAIDHMGGLGIALVRADGTLDPAVTGTGSNLPVTGGDAIASVMQADGRVVVAGSDSSPEGAAWILARFEADLVVPPDTMLAYIPIESPTQSRDATMSFTSSKPGSTFECSMDGSAFSPCTNPVAMTGLAEGPHAFKVRAIDSAGTVDPTPAERSWIIDLPPDITITSGPSGTVRWPVTFTFSSSDPAATFQCQVFGPTGLAMDGPCGATFPMGGGPDGAYEFRVRARDAVGTLSVVAAVRAFTVDMQPPLIMLTSVPPNPSTSDTATFTFTANESGVTFACLFDNSGFLPCMSPFTRTGLAPGQHLFVVRATDAAGNLGPDAIYQWTVNLVPPTVDTAITSGPGSPFNGLVVFTFASSISPATFECRVDNSAYFACASPFTVGIPPAGPHSFEVRAIANGMPDPTPATASWTQGTAGGGAPDTTITSGPSGVISGPAVYTFVSSSSPAIFECRVDGGSFFPCSSPMNLGVAPPGMHTFEVRALGPTGPDPTPASATWGAAGIPNTMMLPSTPPPPAPSVTFTFSSSIPGSTFECRIDTGAYSACASPYTLTGPGGVHTLYVRARWGNDVDATPAQSPFYIDGTPDTTITLSPQSPTTFTTATFRYESNLSGATFECKLDSGVFSGCSPGGITYGGLSRATHSFQVRARSTSGLLDPTPATFVWRVQ